MNRKNVSNFAFCVCLLVLFFGCSKEKINDKCNFDAKASVAHVEGPETAMVNQEVDLTVTFLCLNGIGKFKNLEETISGNTTLITVMVKYEGCFPTDELPFLETTYKFKKSQKGTYDLKFLQSGNTYLTHTINVQ